MNYLSFITYVAGFDITQIYGFKFQNLGDLISTLVNPAITFAALAILFFFVYGAFKYMQAGGNKEEIEGARNMIYHAIIGFVLFLFFFLVVEYLMGVFGLPPIIK